MKNFIHYCILGMVWGLAGVTRADDADTSRAEATKSASFFVSPDAAGGLHFAPDREVAVLHLALTVTPDFHKRTVAGTETLQFKPNARPVRELKLDAVDLDVESVTATEAIQAYQVTADHLIITFAGDIPVDKTASVTISYHATPDLGLYFRTPEMGYKEGDTHCFAQGEEIEARHWYPCFDSPNVKFTSEVTCLVPPGMTVVSNGRLVSQVVDAASGLTAFHWSQEQPHANYLITLVAGYFKELDGKHGSVPLAFLTPPSEFAQAANSFRETDEIMGFLEQEIGVPFPWAKYDQTCVNDFVAGGMENTSATTLTDSTLFEDDTEDIHNSQSLVSHEMAHQWFGDLVTCKDWSHIWLNEGFATYYQVLYDGWKNGREALLYDLYVNARTVTGMANDTNAIVRRNYSDPQEMFNYLAYPKGGWVLNMLRSQLGPDLYRCCIKTYLERHRYGNVTTDDLRAVIEELSGRSYDQFFDQWVYHAHYPELGVTYSWDEIAKLAKISIHQNQEVGDNVRLFNFPLTVRFKGKFGTIDRVAQVSDVAGDFYFPLESAPAIVRVDPDYAVLAKTTFALPKPMLFAQLADPTDVIGRLLAIENLADNHDAETVAKLKEALNSDAFFGVRIEAAKALHTLHTDEALAALLESTNQSSARVRAAVVTAVGGYYRDTARQFLLGEATNEKNPAIKAEAIHSLGVYGGPEIQNLLVKNLRAESFHETLAGAAIMAIRSEDDPVYISPLLDTLKKREQDFPSRSYAQGLGTLAHLARNEEKKDAVREFLVGHLNDKKKTVQRSAITALGTLGDPKAEAAVATFATATADSPEHAAAVQAVALLDVDRKPADDFKGLRTEVTDLQKSNRSLRKDLDDFKKQVEAREKEGNPSPVKPRTAS